MDSVLKKGLFLVTISSLVMGISLEVEAADTDSVLPGAGIEEVLNDYDASDHKVQVKEYLVPTEKGEYSDMAFANVHSFLYIRSEPTKQSKWVGKLYPDYAAKIKGPVGEWTKIKSGDVTGYVYSQYITIGKKAQKKAKEMKKFHYARSRKEEEAILAKQREASTAETNGADGGRAGSGQAVVEYASRFIGNPYVWGGTSLTHGADCSGFVQSVYKHFGIQLPRTSSQMRSAGRAVSYSNARPGDVICYNGHVGIYKGNGQIVNAINRARGIGILSATYANIITVRRLL